MVAVTVVGSVNLDLVATLDVLPAPGQTRTASGLERLPGGKGANQALAAVRLGARTRLVAAVGADTAAEAALELLRGGGVALGAVRQAEAPTGIAMIEVDRAGETTIVVVPGANAALEVSAADVAGADAVLSVLEVPDAAVAAAAEHAPGLFVLNAAPARPVPAAVLRRADLVVVNRGEYDALPGLDAARAVAVTEGAAGARLLRHGQEVARASPPPVTAVDGTGAGDAFAAAMAVGLVEGRSDTDLLARGCAAGALAATRAGAQPALPSRAEIEKVLGT